MQKIHSFGRTKPIVMAMTMAVAAIALTACGGSSSSKSSSEEKPNFTDVAKAFDCEPSSTQGKRVICIGSADDLSDANVQNSLTEALAMAETGDTFVLPQGRYNFKNTIEFNGAVDGVEV